MQSKILLGLMFVFKLVWFFANCLLVFFLSFFRLIIKPKKKSLENEVVLVTGAAVGLGRELALEFARKGAHLVLWDINQEDLQKTEKNVQDLNVKAISFVCDVSDRNAVYETMKKVFQKMGKVTILVNNAAIAVMKPFSKLKDEEIRKIMEVNIMSNYWIIKAVLPQMTEAKHGHIVAISSATVFFADSLLVPYISSKFAMRGLMESLRGEYYVKKSNLRFTTVFPSSLNTPAYKQSKHETKYKWLVRITEPEDAAQQIVDGVQRNYDEIFVPGNLEFMLKLFSLFPKKIIFLIFDFIYGDLKIRAAEKCD